MRTARFRPMQAFPPISGADKRRPSTTTRTPGYQEYSQQSQAGKTRMCHMSDTRFPVGGASLPRRPGGRLGYHGLLYIHNDENQANQTKETAMEPNETKNETSHALTRPALDSETWAEWMPEIQNAGVDSLEFSFDIEIGQAMWDRLEEEKVIAQVLKKTRKAEHVPDWLNAVVHPVGAKGGYRFLLETPTFSIKLLKGVPNRPPIYVEMRAYGLHTHEGGAIGA